MSICQHCKQQPAVLNDRHGVLCTRCWTQINTSCRPDVAPTPGLEHGLTRRSSTISLVEDSKCETPATTTPAADARLRGPTGTIYE